MPYLNIVKGKNLEINDLSGKVMIKCKIKDIEDITCKDIYWEHISQISSLPKAETKWKSYLNIEDIHWQDHYVIPFNVSRETSLQSFQYKIFHRFFPCNYTLSIWYKDQNCLCNLCNQTDYLEHYFYFCPNVQHLWHAIQKWWKSILEVTINLNEIYILFGIPNTNTNDDSMIDVLNMCILYAKWYIFTCKKDNVQLFLQ